MEFEKAQISLQFILQTKTQPQDQQRKVPQMSFPFPILRLPLLTLSAVISVVAFSLPARSVPVVDQSNHATNITGNALIFNTGTSFQELAQTFTVGVAGTLTRIDVEASRTASSVGTLVLEVQGVTGAGLPNGSVLASRTLTAPEVVTGFNTFDISAANLAVNIGDVLSFVLKGTGDYDVLLTGFLGDSYSGGTGYFQSHTQPGFSTSLFGPDADLRFDTFVDAAVVAEPGALALLVLGLGITARRRRTRRL